MMRLSPRRWLAARLSERLLVRHLLRRDQTAHTGDLTQELSPGRAAWLPARCTADGLAYDSLSGEGHAGGVAIPRVRDELRPHTRSITLGWPHDRFSGSR